MSRKISPMGWALCGEKGFVKQPSLEPGMKELRSKRRRWSQSINQSVIFIDA